MAKKLRMNRSIKKLKKSLRTKASVGQKFFSAFALEVLTREDIPAEYKDQFKLLFSNWEVKLKATSADDDLKLANEAINIAYQREPKPITCQKNCSACCHQKVDVLEPEQALILKYLKDNPVPIDSQKIDMQMLRRHQPWQEKPFAQRACVFLDEHRACSIYPVRPISCRRYYVTSPPEFCLQEDRGKIDYGSHLECDAIISVLLNKYSFKSIPEFLAETLG